MAEGELDKSEQATPFKLQKAREKGTVARGSDLGFLAGVVAMLIYLWINGSGMAGSIAVASRRAFASAGASAENPYAILSIAAPLFSSALEPLLLMIAAVFTTVLAFEVLQTGFIFSGHPLKPDFSRLNPAAGLKRLFTMRLLIETAKNILKMCSYVVAGYLVINHVIAAELGSVQDASDLAALIARSAFRLAAWFAAIALVFAVLDQLIARRDFRKRMAMSRREVKRETRDREGDSRLKQKRKQLHGEFAKQSQSLSNLKGADVVITNPEHIALALRYDQRTMQAPMVVSIGVDHFARQIKHIALLYGIPVIENRSLARALYGSVVLNRQIPEAYFLPVADIYNDLRARTKAMDGDQ
jgi:flagellar biosynthetic protein FlhB